MSAANGALVMPYPGLRPFEEEDQPLFFGREAQISTMLRQLEDHRFVAVVGSSGSGKSSLVRAGLLPAVREGFLLGTTDWLTIIIKPGHQPYQRLVRALSVATCCTKGGKAVPALDDPLTPDETATLAMLRRTDRGLLIALDQLAISPKSRVMVVVDQFEELFAFRRAGVNRDTVASRDEAAAFVVMLMRSASESAGRVWAILTMRSDFIGDCEAFLGLPEQISHSQFLVPRLDRGQMEEAIVRPAEVKEGAFKTFTFEEGLVNRIINDAGDRPDQLRLRQHGLMRAWKHAVARTGASGSPTVMPEDYEAAGGIEMALSFHADAAWDEIKDDPEKAHIARRLFLLLCDISPDGQITRRRPQVAEVQSVTGASIAKIEQVVRVFQQDDRNFLLPPPPLTGESYLDISHEALLRQWRLFAGEWQEEERQDACELRRLADLARLRKQGQGGLLPAQDLERIDRWKERISAEWSRRYVTNEEWEEALSFVEESRAQVKREEEQRQKQARQKKVLLRWVAIALIVATTFSTVFMLRALNSEKKAKISESKAQISAVASKEAQQAAQEALTRSFERTIGVYSFGVLQLDERAALWELAELDPASIPVRKGVMDHWFENEKSLPRALNRQAEGLHAAVGLNLDLRNYSASKVTEMAERLAKALEDTKTDLPKMSRLSSVLTLLAAQMEPSGARNVADGLAKALEDLEDPKTAVYRMSLLSNVLEALAARMEPKEAADVSSRSVRVLVKAAEDPQTAAYNPAGWNNALVALADRMEPNDARNVADSLAKALEDTKTDPSKWSRLSNALAALATRMETKDAASLFKALEGSRIAAYKPAESSKALAALAARMEPNDARNVADGLAKALGDTKTDPSKWWRLSNALATLAAHMEPKEAAEVSSRGAQLVAKALEDPKTDPDKLSEFGNALAALAAHMEPKEAAVGLLKALDNPQPQENDTGSLVSLGRALGMLSLRVPSARQTRCLALSMILLNEVPAAPKIGEVEPKERKQLAELYALIDPQDLAEVLKWPFTVGEAEKITLE